MFDTGELDSACGTGVCKNRRLPDRECWPFKRFEVDSLPLPCNKVNILRCLLTIWHTNRPFLRFRQSWACPGSTRRKIGRSRPCWSRVSSCFLPDPSRSWFAIAFDCLRPRLARCPQMLGLNVPRKHTKRDWSPHSSEKHPPLQIEQSLQPRAHRIPDSTTGRVRPCGVGGIAITFPRPKRIRHEVAER